MAIGDQDLNFKLRMQAILWRLGYYTRIDVKLASTRESSRQGQRKQPSLAELTDIDVLGIRYDADYTISYAVADCTTGGRLKGRLGPVGRTFWLRGVMDHFRADRGYEVLSKKLSSYEKRVAANLGITLLDESSLQALEERYHTDRTPLKIRLTDDKAYTYLESNIHRVDSRLAPLLNYRKYAFWQNQANRNLLNAISIVRKAHNILEPSQKFQRILLLDIVTLVSVAFLEACGILFRTSPDNVLEALRTYLFGGPLALQTKETLLKDINTLVESLQIQPSLFPEETMRRLSLDPEYLPALSDMAQRFISKPSEARNVPRYLQAIILERALYDGNPLRDIFIDEYSDITFKFVHDLAQFFKDATGVNPAMFQDLEKD
ncbi:MAG: hypothetical protein E3J21_06710 [Anaerolineales bacterium]|nr:MAG: hypothetical protein E3J21_06710 [Anaerolineales bacterium]